MKFKKRNESDNNSTINRCHTCTAILASHSLFIENIFLFTVLLPLYIYMYIATLKSNDTTKQYEDENAYAPLLGGCSEHFGEGINDWLLRNASFSYELSTLVSDCTKCKRTKFDTCALIPELILSRRLDRGVWHQPDVELGGFRSRHRTFHLSNPIEELWYDVTALS